MSSHDWHVLGSFGLLAAALALVDGKWAVQLVGLAAIVVIVRHPSTIERLLP